METRKIKKKLIEDKCFKYFKNPYHNIKILQTAIIMTALKVQG